MIEIKETELSIKAYAKKMDITEQHVHLLIRKGNVKWRYLFPETKEYKLIDSDYVLEWEKQVTLKKIFKNK